MGCGDLRLLNRHRVGSLFGGGWGAVHLFYAGWGIHGWGVGWGAFILCRVGSKWVGGLGAGRLIILITDTFIGLFRFLCF